jgi:hypothetical protein
MVQLFAILVPLALAAAVNPAMILTTLALLSTNRPLARAGSFLLGATLVCLVVGVAALLGFSNLGLTRHHEKSAAVTTWVDLVVGIGLLLLATWAWLRRPSGAAKTPAVTPPGRRMEVSPTVACLMGAGIMVSNLKALGIYLVGVHEIVLADPDTAATLTAMGVFVLIMFCGIELPILLYLLAPDTAGRLLTTVRLWLTAHARALTIMIAVVAGVFLVVKGLNSWFG